MKDGIVNHAQSLIEDVTEILDVTRKQKRGIKRVKIIKAVENKIRCTARK